MLEIMRVSYEMIYVHVQKYMFIRDSMFKYPDNIVHMKRKSKF